MAFTLHFGETLENQTLALLSIAFAWKSLKFDSRGWWWSFLTVADVGDFLTIFLNFRLVDVNSKAGNAALNKNPTDSTL